MMRQKKFTELTEWQKLVRKVAEEHPEYKSNRQRVEEAKRIWLSTRPPSIKKKRVNTYKPPPPPKQFEAITPWQKHYYKVAHENPQLVTTKQKYKLAYQLWMVENGSDKDFQRYLDLNF
jgi:FMN phosphatase YigB (HAD superfamily)